jgi:16S rRNA (adenine1518-N6/adenine1519-N6)-dimethyltransferase
MRKNATKELLQQHDLAPHKKLGQNFLVNPMTAESIVHCGNISEDVTIVEVGVGLGALTKPLAKRAKHVFGVEIDSGLIRYHKEENDLPENITLIHNDILKVDFNSLMQQCGEPLKIMANLPYSISNPFIFKLIENRSCVEWVVVMLQKEVADRLMASPSSKEYGIPTVLLQSCAQVKKLMTLKPHEFHPQPKIDSVVIRIDFSPKPQRVKELPPFDYNLFNTLVRTAFGKRRKTLLNNIASINLFVPPDNFEKRLNKEITERVIRDAGLSPGIRAENLAVEDFVQLAIVAYKHKI